MEELVTTIARRADFRSAEAVEICKIGLRNYFAGALVLPYQTFLSAAKELRHDLELLASRFSASLEQVAHRLSTLQRSGQRGVPVFLLVSTGRGTLPSATVPPSCNLRATARPVRSGMCTKHSRRRDASSASLRKRRMARAISASRQNLPRARAVSMLRSAVMQSRLDVKSPMRGFRLCGWAGYHHAFGIRSDWCFLPYLRSGRVRPACRAAAESRLAVDHDRRGILPYRLL